MKAIIGLGNPGKEYELTRHNVGFLVVDNYLNDVKWSSKMGAKIYNTVINGEKVVFIKPQSFMNLSGLPIKKIMDYYKIDAKDIMVIHDDLDLEKCTYKLKYVSSSGGHNGIKDIIKNLHTNEFLRLKIGVSNNKKIDTKDYVLSKLSTTELKYIKSDLFKEIIETFISKDAEETMHIYNTMR